MAKGIKTGGRVAGTPNKTTEELRNTVQLFVERNIKKLQLNFDLLEPKEKLLFIEKMLKMVLPQPMNDLERFTDEQLDQIILRLKNEKK